MLCCDGDRGIGLQGKQDSCFSFVLFCISPSFLNNNKKDGSSSINGNTVSI